MAIYRSDQAIFTFASEGTPGAMPERATVSGSNYAGATVLTAQANAGDTQILVSSGSGTYPSSDSQVRGSYVVINYLGAAARGSSEIRRVIKVQTGDALTLDTPFLLHILLEQPLVLLIRLIMGMWVARQFVLIHCLQMELSIFHGFRVFMKQ